MSEEFVSVFISTSNKVPIVEKKFLKQISVAELKGKLELITGGNLRTMKLKLFDKDDKLIADLSNDDTTLESAGAKTGYRLHVEDKFVVNQLDLEDLESVPKFELSKEEYSKRTDTIQAYLKKNKLGKYSLGAGDGNKVDLEEEKAKELEVGKRCEVTVTGQPNRRGTVMYVGTTKFKPGHWVGIKYDEPTGKNDGSVDGERYFECPPKYGGFVKPSCVTIGDFPEEELNFDDEL